MSIKIKNRFEIIDDNGTIHSGNEDEMYQAFDVMTNSDEYSKKEIDKWLTATFPFGDLKLVEVKLVYR